MFPILTTGRWYTHFQHGSIGEIHQIGQGFSARFGQEVHHGGFIMTGSKIEKSSPTSFRV